MVGILDQDNLLRRVPTHIPNYVKPDGTITSMAFCKKRNEDGVSVDLERLSSFERATLGDRRYRLLRINAGIIRHQVNEGLDATHNPQPDNDAHCLIIGPFDKKKEKQLLKHSTEIAAPLFQPINREQSQDDNPA